MKFAAVADEVDWDFVAGLFGDRISSEAPNFKVAPPPGRLVSGSVKVLKRSPPGRVAPERLRV
jgi:hypothetical protein